MHAGMNTRIKHNIAMIAAACRQEAHREATAVLRRGLCGLSSWPHHLTCPLPSFSLFPFSLFSARFSFLSTPSAAAPASPSSESHSDFAPIRKSRVSSSVDDAKAQISQDIASHDVFLYMKGTPAQPRCGFSANVVRILSQYPEVQFGSRDVLEDEFVREAIKQHRSAQCQCITAKTEAKEGNTNETPHPLILLFALMPSLFIRLTCFCSCLSFSFSDWPTLPQLFVRGEFVGGSDIVTDLWRRGELDALLKSKPKPQQQEAKKE